MSASKIGMCGVCNKMLPKDGRVMTCSECNASLHVSKKCSGIADTTFVSMGTAKRETWKCKRCQSPRGAKSRNSASESESEPSGIKASEASVTLAQIKESVDALLPLHAKVDSLLALKPTMEELLTMKNTIKEMENAVEHFSKQYDVLIEKVKAAEKVEKEMKRLTTTVAEQDKRIQELQSSMNELEQYSRRSNMEVHGLAASKGENLRTALSDLASKLEIPNFDNRDILVVHRLPSRDGACPPVLIKFASAEIRDTWLSMRKKLRSLSNQQRTPALFFNENLTPANKHLFWLARTKCRELKFKYVWVKNGRILVKKDEEEPIIRIVCQADLDKIA